MGHGPKPRCETGQSASRPFRGRTKVTMLMTRAVVRSPGRARLPHWLAKKGRLVTAATPTPCQNLGFLSIFQDPSGFVGGYLVTNPWGRPLEFRLSSAVAPDKVQQILYGDTLAGYLCGEVIGKTLIDKTATPVRWVLVDNPRTLNL